MAEKTQFGNQRPMPSFRGFGEPVKTPEQAVVNAAQAHAAAPEDAQLILPADHLHKDYSVSVDEIRLLLFANGIEKSKDTIQRYCREGRLDAVKLGLLRRYFATPLSVERLIEYLQTDAVDIEATELDAAASTSVQVHEGTGSFYTPELQLHAGAEPSAVRPEPEPHAPAPTRMQAHADANDGDMVEFLKGQINVKDKQIEVKDNQIAAMLERDRETNFLIRELQTHLSNTFRLVSGGEGNRRDEGSPYREPVGRPADIQHNVENSIGQSPGH